MSRRTADCPSKSHYKSKHRIRQQNDHNISFLLQTLSLINNGLPYMDNKNGANLPDVADDAASPYYINQAQAQSIVKKFCLLRMTKKSVTCF